MNAKKLLLLLVLLAGCGATQRWPTEEQMSGVKEGMTRSEVEKVMGRAPDGGIERRSGEEIAAWRIRDDAANDDTVYFQVHYRAGTVTRTTRAVLSRAQP